MTMKGGGWAQKVGLKGGSGHIFSEAEISGSSCLNFQSHAPINQKTHDT